MRRALAFAAVALSLSSLAGCVSMDRFKKKEAEASRFRQDWEDEVAKRAVLQEKIATMQAQLETLVADVSSLREKIRSDEDSLAVKEGELRASRDRLVELQALVDELSKSKRRLEAAKAELEKKSDEYAQLASSLRGEIEAGRVELMELRGRTTVQLKDKILFASGSATVGADGKDALRKVADALKGLQGKVIRVEGHTDNVPTGAAGPFASNWELSSARALAVVHFLQDAGVDPTRLSGAGFAEFQPIGPNDTPEGRSLNRRIEIVLVPIEGAVAPAKAAEPAAAPKL
jgi:chemotaxis protein MotB